MRYLKKYNESIFDDNLMDNLESLGKEVVNLSKESLAFILDDRDIKFGGEYKGETIIDYDYFT